MFGFASTGIVEPWFRKKPKKHGRDWPLVDAPKFPVSTAIADTHAHLNCLSNPALSIAQAAYWNVSFIESMTDPLSDEGLAIYDTLPAILQEATEILEGFSCAENPVAEGGVDSAAPSSVVVNAALASNENANGDMAQIAAKLPEIKFACGVHPHYAKDYSDEVEATLTEKLRDPKTTALGEVGLDYHYDFSDRDSQIQVFERQIELSQKAELPIILHVREAFDDAYACMKNAGFNKHGVLLHCYTAEAHEIERWLEAGCYIAFGGALTFKKLDEVREACKLVPRDLLLTETDSPYMAPEPFRSSECGPAHTIFTFQRML
ncbi:MAG: TatD family hydrolase, partial [Phoenicibacter congonensis]|nr:TatD family hydrolase [Phoenicibacter congonensis]